MPHFRHNLSLDQPISTIYQPKLPRIRTGFKHTPSKYWHGCCKNLMRQLGTPMMYSYHLLCFPPVPISFMSFTQRPCVLTVEQVAFRNLQNEYNSYFIFNLFSHGHYFLLYHNTENAARSSRRDRFKALLFVTIRQSTPEERLLVQCSAQYICTAMLSR